MELKNCLECGRSFASQDGETYCKRCTEMKIEDDFKKVRDYLYENPNSDIKVVAEDTGVSEKIILKLLRADRIEISEEENNILKCVSCGVPIKSGKHCSNCKKMSLALDLKNVKNSIKDEILSEQKKKNTGFYSR